MKKKYFLMTNASEMGVQRIEWSLAPLKADSHLPQGSVLSAVDCINAEIENFQSFCGNATVH